MASNTDDFFEGKRPWSIIKDEVLASYMPIYLAKVKFLQRPILIVDGFAGPGIFDDGTEGSPIIICRSADAFLKGGYQAVFINKNKEHHQKLTHVLEKENWQGSARSILGDTTKILPMLPAIIRDFTVFLYLDPFGPTGSSFNLLEPFLTRGTAHSTEIVLMLHMPVLHRLAARNKFNEGGETPQIHNSHMTLTRVFGGDYWKKIMFNPDLTTEEREKQLVSAYTAKLSQYLPYVGSCPVRTSERDRIKYFIVFASGHPDAMLKMNDIMAQAYFKRMHMSAFAGTLFEKTTWEEQRTTKGLREAIILQSVKYPGFTRKNLWVKVIQENFMRYLEKEYRAAVNLLINEGVLACPTPRKTKRLNDDCELFIATK